MVLVLLLCNVYINYPLDCPLDCPLAAGRNFRSQDPAKHPILLCFDPSRSHKASGTSSPDESINTLSTLLYVICLHSIEPLKKKKKNTWKITPVKSTGIMYDLDLLP